MTYAIARAETIIYQMLSKNVNVNEDFINNTILNRIRSKENRNIYEIQDAIKWIRVRRRA